MAAAAAAVAGAIQGVQTDQETSLGEKEGDPLVVETQLSGGQETVLVTTTVMVGAAAAVAGAIQRGLTNRKTALG